MSLLRDILEGYLYYEDVQRLAAEHDLPVSRTKDELVDELVAGGYLEPEEVVAFLRVADLRDICAELDIPGGASRDVLAERVADAIRAEEEPAPRRRKRRSAQSPAPSKPQPLPQQPSEPVARPTEGNGRPLTPVSIHFNLPPSRPAEGRPARTEVSRTGWGFVGIIYAVVLSAAVPLSIYLLGTIVGSLVVLGVGLVLALGLWLTSTSWSGWVDQRFRKQD